MQLASRFTYRSPVLRSNHPLSDDQIRTVAPSIFADTPHESRSERYSYIPTAAVLTELRKEGFQPFMVCQTRVRREDRRDYTKHMLRLRHESQINGDEANEIVLINSHDGTSSYQVSHSAPWRSHPCLFDARAPTCSSCIPRRRSTDAASSRARTGACAASPSAANTDPMDPRGSLPTQWAAIRVSMRLTIGGSWGGRSSVAMIFVSSSIRMKAFSRFILNGDGDLEASRTAMQLLLRAAALTRNGI